MSADVDWVVIGAGVVGAACAHALSRAGASVLVLDREAGPGHGTTSRNSGVIHAGIYYPKASLKTELCIRGQHLLYEWCAKHSVPHMKCGKIITAFDESEVPLLEKLHRSATECGARELQLVDGVKMRELEPASLGVAAIWSPTTGIVDGEALTKSLLASCVEADSGFDVIYKADVVAIARAPDHWVVETTRGPLRTSGVVNSAGLYSDDIARMAGAGDYKIHPCRGDYFKLKSAHRFKRLVYPMKKPGAAGLGIHVTLDLAGGVRLGPDAEFVDSKTDFSPREGKLEKFHTSASKLIPGLKKEDLFYDMVGIRPKLRAPHESEEKDFIISEDAARFINLIGIESPGLTASLAIAEKVAALARG
ncbi:MAG: NAD(P)/FAD-dependent oxidoreductase [Bdellovibrionota bacterium]